MNRSQQRRDLKQKRKQLLEEMGISMTSFKRKMPKVDKGGKDFEVVNPYKFIKHSKSKGKKASLSQQVSWLEDLKEATKELRELREQVEQEKAETLDKSETDVKDESSFKVV